jgi:hypothetical protein
MLKLSCLVAAGALLLCAGAVTATALPYAGARGADPAGGVERVQYAGDRCFNRCLAGWVYRRCQLELERSQVVSCCSTRCNWFY